MPDRNAQPDIHRTEQGVLNKSFDETYQVLAVEQLVHNPTTGNLDRQTQPTTPDDIQNVEIINALRALLQQIATPVWYDPTTNTLKVGTHAVTVSSGTVTTVTTLTNLTNFGSNAADVMTRDTSINTWANVCRRTIS